MNMKNPEKTSKTERSGSKYLRHDGIQRNAHDDENHVRTLLPEILVLQSDLDLPSAAAPVNYHDKKKKKKKKKETKETAAPRVKAKRRASWHHSAPFEKYVTNPDNDHASQPKNNSTSEEGDKFKIFQRRRSSSCGADMGDWNLNEIYKKSTRSIQRPSASIHEVSFAFGEALHIAADTRESSAVDAEFLLAPTLVTRRAGLDGSSLHSSSNCRDYSLSRECKLDAPLLASSEGLAATGQPRTSHQGHFSMSPRLSKSRSRGASIPDIQGTNDPSFEMLFGDEPIPPLPALRQTKSAFSPPQSRLHNQASFSFLQQFKAAAVAQRRESCQGRRSMSPSLRQARSPGSSDPNIQGNGCSLEMDFVDDEPIPPPPALRQSKSAFVIPPPRLHNQASFPFIQPFKATAVAQNRESRQGRRSMSPSRRQVRAPGGRDPDILGNGLSFEKDVLNDEPIPPPPALRQTKSAFAIPPTRLHNQASFPFLQPFKATAVAQRRESRQGRRSMSPSLRQARSPGSSDPNGCSIEKNDHEPIPPPPALRQSKSAFVIPPPRLHNQANCRFRHTLATPLPTVSSRRTFYYADGKVAAALGTTSLHSKLESSSAEVDLPNCATRARDEVSAALESLVSSWSSGTATANEPSEEHENQHMNFGCAQATGLERIKPTDTSSPLSIDLIDGNPKERMGGFNQGRPQRGSKRIDTSIAGSFVPEQFKVDINDSILQETSKQHTRKISPFSHSGRARSILAESPKNGKERNKDCRDRKVKIALGRIRGMVQHRVVNNSSASCMSLSTQSMPEIGSFIAAFHCEDEGSVECMQLTGHGEATTCSFPDANACEQISSVIIPHSVEV